MLFLPSTHRTLIATGTGQLLVNRPSTQRVSVRFSLIRGLRLSQNECGGDFRPPRYRTSAARFTPICRNSACVCYAHLPNEYVRSFRSSEACAFALRVNAQPADLQKRYRPVPTVQSSYSKQFLQFKVPAVQSSFSSKFLHFLSSYSLKFLKFKFLRS